MSHQVEVLTQSDIEDYIHFLVRNFTQEMDSDYLYEAARREVSCMFSDYFRKPVFYKYLIDGELMGAFGFIREWVAPNTYSIFWVCVDKPHRGQGIGTKIMERAIEELATTVLEGQPGTLILYCLEHNCGYYEKFGFERGPKGHRWIFMSKPINT